MTGPRRGTHPDELISASLSNDLTDAERAILDAHLAGCATCRDTLAAFSEQRRLVAGLRAVPPRRDLSARVRAGIDAGRYAQVPWWRRTSTLLGFSASLATVAAGILAVVIFTNLRPGPEVVLASTTPLPSAPLASSPASPEPSDSLPPVPTPGPIADAGDPVYSLALTGPPDNLAPTVRDGGTGQTIVELEALGIEGPPISASLQPYGTSLAYMIDTGLKGTVEVRVSSVIDGRTYVLGESAVGGPFVEHLAWSTEGRYLAFALADVDGQAGTNVFIFDTLTPDQEPTQLTDSGNAYVGSWDVDAEGELLWFSEAGTEPISYAVRPYDADGAPLSLPDGPIPALRFAEGVFQPLINRDRSAVIFWRGVMQTGDTDAPRDWRFVQGGAPYVARASEEGIGFARDEPLFTDLTIGQEGFSAAAITWGPDNRSIAVWDARWTPPPQSSDGSAYPDQRRVYFGHLDDPRLLTANHAIDEGDVPEDARVVDVALAATGRHLALTVAYSLAGDLDPPRADLLLVTRNTGSMADVVETVAGATFGGWHGPAVYSPITGGGAAP